MTGARGDRLLLPGFWRRLLAGVVDVVGGVGVALGAVRIGLVDVGEWTAVRPGYLWIESAAMRLAEDPTGVILTGAELGLGLVVWNAVWALVATRTPGEWVARLEVIDATGLRAGRLRLLVRALAYASWGVSLGFAAGLPWVSRTHRGLPDLAARTWVVAVD